MAYGRCYFLDVGQGTANVIILKGRRAVVLDAGPVKRVGAVHRLLKDFADTIECVLLSHHDRDHIAGWEQIASDYQRNIGAIWCIPDADPEPGNRIDLTMSLAEKGTIPRPRPAMVDSLAAVKTIWKDKLSPLQLDIFYPDMTGAYKAVAAGKPNRASVVAALGYGNDAILFPGDCEIEAWRRLRDESPHLPLKVDVVAVPHHGGLPGGTPAELAWLYKDAVQSRVAVVSAGSSNDEGHPRPQVIHALRNANARVMCTQITPQCHPALEPLRPGVIKPLALYSTSGATPNLTSAGRSRNVACAATVAADLQERGVVVQRVNEHGLAVRAKLKTPLCMP